jgi:hypothetical protein
MTSAVRRASHHRRFFRNGVHNLVGQKPVCFPGRVGTEPTDAAGTAVVDAALRPMRDTLAADGYGLEWSLEEQNRIGIQVFVAGDACADCLVAPETIRAIIDTALHETPYTVGNITLPKG